MPIKSCYIFLTILIKVLTYVVVDSVSVVDKGVLPLVENSIGIKFYVDVTNENRHSSCNLYSRCQRCCLIDAKKEDCNVITGYGDSMTIVKPRDRQTMLYVVLSLQQHDLLGFCDFIMNYTCDKINNNTVVKIPFDTRLREKKAKALMEEYIDGKKVSRCNTFDEDSLKNCEPVNCDIKYLDRRPIFDHYYNKCTEAPICLSNPNKQLPDNVYVPNSNICRNLDMPLSVQDIYAISSGIGVVTVTPLPNIDLKVEVKSNCSTISQNINLIYDLMCGKLCPLAKGMIVDYSKCFKSALKTIFICIISVCCVLFIFVCCVNTAVWFYIQWCEGNLRKIWKNLKSTFRKRNCKRSKRERVNSTIRNALLREVVIKDIPLELRNSLIDVCDRMGKEVEKKKRYRTADVGSQISLKTLKEDSACGNSTSSSNT